ncbi:MAG: secretin N-terminal domain-containing protein [Desulfobacterales bacterium]|jgi:type II secretory pathway component GspD/PulD (secretin)
MKIFRKKFTFKYFPFFGLVTALILFCSVLAANEVAVIKVKYRRAAELVPVVQSLLSADGSVTVSQRVNSLVIVDNPDAIRRVYAYLERFDTPVEQVRIHVRFNTDASDEERAVAARGRYSNDNVSVVVGGKKKDGAEISVQDRGHRRSGTSSAFVVAMSGSPAFIRTGKEIPYRQGSAFFRRHAPGGETVVWRTAESGFEVTPIVAGENVHLKILPRVAYDDRKDAVIRFFEAQTELTVPFGQWVEIGGSTDRQNEIFREILSRSKGGGKSVNTVSIMVERH